MGEPLPYTVKLELSPTIKQQMFRYTDSCGQLGEIQVGRQIEEALREGAYQTFKTVIDEENGDKTITPDHLVKIDVHDWSFDLDKDALYDRAPATLKMNVIARIYDMQGALLRETEFKVLRRERLRLERLGRNCDYIIDPFIQDAAIELASKVFLDARVAFGEPPSSTPVAQAPVPVPPIPSPTGGSSPTAAAPSAPSMLRFKAILLDENGNLMLEGGEHVRVRIDVVNTGRIPIQNAFASLTGTPAVIGQFPATTLTIPPLQPGQTKSLEFMATLPPTPQPQQAEIHVAVIESGGTAAPSQTLSLTIQPAGAAADDVDQIPAPVPGFQQPQTYLIAIGVGTYRDPQILSRKYASMDAERVADYFQTLGGVPPSNVRLLLDSKARRTDVNEVFADWLPLHAAKNAVVIVYFSGQAMVTPTGEVLLALHDGSPAAATHLYPLKSIESALARLNAQQTLFVFDGPLSKLRGESDIEAIAPRWDVNGGSTIRIINGEEFKTGLEDDKHRHGLFTYFLLRGLRGEADTNRNGSVTLGELAGYVRQKVAWAAKSQFNVEQRPLILPPLKPDDKAAALILSTLASLTSSERP
jgi:hypothetical protein